MNTVTFTGPQHKLDQLEQATVKDTLLEFMAPVNRTSENWFQIQVSAWGTKWDISDVYIDNDTEQDSIEFSFSTAWAPPVEAFYTWAAQDGRVQFDLQYWEPGCGLVGTTRYDGEYLDSDDVDCNSDPARYKQIASDVWGYEEYDEPEPLTEWYKDGVEAKGLA
jgi:hypothetical protein